MAITISGENNNDKILASDGVIDQISGINIVGVLTATSFTGDLTGDVTGNLTGNVTGNINNTTLLLQTGGTERVRIDSSGRVLIGTTTEGIIYGDNLTVADSGHAGITIRSGTSAGGNIYFSDGTSGDDEKRGVVSYDHGNNFMRFYTNAAERLRITSSGLVGIGTDNPTTLIDVLKTSNNAKIKVRCTTAGAYFEADSASSGYVGLILSSSGTQRWLMGGYASNNFTIKDGGTGGDERFTIVDGTGKVGINEPTPLGKLHVKSSDSGATVGASADELVIESSANTGMTILSGTANEGTINFGDSGDNNIGKITYMHNGNYMYFKTNDSERLRILSDGTIRGGSQLAAQPSTTVAGFQFDAGGGYLRISKGGGASGTDGTGMSLIGGGSNTNHLATTSWGSNIYLINTNLTDNNANALVFANKNSLASSMIVGKNDSHASRNGSLIFATSLGSSPTQRMRITKEGSINIGADSTQSTHMLYMQGTGDVGIHLRADTDNSGENDNPYISMGQDGAATQQFKLGMAGDANTAFNMQIANSPFVHANNGNSQPLQLAHMTDMVATLSSVSTLASTGQSATDPRDFFSNGSLSGNAVGGLKIHHYGNDTAAALMLTGHNNSGTPGAETGTQLTHTGANLRFHIEHHGIEAFNIGPTGNIYLKNCSTIPSFTTSYNVSAISLKGGSLMNYQEDNIYLTNNLHYTGSWVNTYAGSGGMIAMGGGSFHHYYYANDSSAGNAQSLIRSVSFYKNNSAGTSLNTGNRPSAQGTIIIWGHSDQTTAGGIEFHSSGGGGAGYGSKITTQSNGTMQFHCRSNNSAWSTYLTISSQNGQVSGNLNDTSDISLKRNVESISTSCIDNIKKLNPVSFEWKAFDSDEKQIGFIAQEVEKVIPEAVKGEDGEKALNVTGIVAQLTKALQESITKIETLEAKVAALEGS